MSDYHYRTIARTDPHTGWPMSEYGHILNGEDVRGAEARDLTSPYGSLEFCVGSGDDFWCFDYATLPNGLMVLHAVINSESGSFIEDADYQIVKASEAPTIALAWTDQAQTWCADNGVRHTRKGWNQDVFYFYRCVTLASKGLYFPDRQKRFGGQRIAAVTTF